MPWNRSLEAMKISMQEVFQRDNEGFCNGGELPDLQALWTERLDIQIQVGQASSPPDFWFLLLLLMLSSHASGAATSKKINYSICNELISYEIW